MTSWERRQARLRRAERAFIDPLQMFLDDRDAEWECALPYL
ncbi:hypothetical protein [Halomarina oriensis]|nr:hypothetical protein [Halomarina oriensis]